MSLAQITIFKKESLNTGKITYKKNTTEVLLVEHSFNINDKIKPLAISLFYESW